MRTPNVVVALAAVVVLVAGAVTLAVVVTGDDDGTDRLVTPPATTTLTFAPLDDPDEPVTEAALEEAATRVRARLDAADINQTTVTVSDGSLLVTVPADRTDAVPPLMRVGQVRFRPALVDPVPADTTPGPTPTPPAGVAPEEFATAFAQFEALSCESAPEGAAADPDGLLAACDRDGEQKFLLAPAIVNSDGIADATAEVGGAGAWIVTVALTNEAQQVWAAYTAQHNSTVAPGDPGNRIAITVDDEVISAPEIVGPISGSATQISGDFDRQQAEQLADVLATGPLPVAFGEPTVRVN